MLQYGLWSLKKTAYNKGSYVIAILRIVEIFYISLTCINKTEKIAGN